MHEDEGTVERLVLATQPSTTAEPLLFPLARPDVDVPVDVRAHPDQIRTLGVGRDLGVYSCVLAYAQVTSLYKTATLVGSVDEHVAELHGDARTAVLERKLEPST